MLQAPIAFAMDTLALATPLRTTNIKMNNKRVLSTTFDMSSLIFARASTFASTPHQLLLDFQLQYLAMVCWLALILVKSTFDVDVGHNDSSHGEYQDKRICVIDILSHF